MSGSSEPSDEPSDEIDSCLTAKSSLGSDLLVHPQLSNKSSSLLSGYLPDDDLSGENSLFLLHSGSTNSDSFQNDNSLAPAIESAVAIAEVRNFPGEDIGDSEDIIVPLLVDVMEGGEESSSALEKKKDEVENEEENVANLARKRTDVDVPDGKRRKIP